MEKEPYKIRSSFKTYTFAPKLKPEKYEFKPHKQIFYSRINYGYGCNGSHVAICN